MINQKFFCGLFGGFLVALVCLCAPSVVFAEGRQVGVVGVAYGAARGINENGLEKDLANGDPVYLEDQFSTGDDGHLQILLLDETVLTIGPASTVKIDEFIYEPVTRDGKLNIDILKGFFRIISGKVAHKKPEHMSVDLPAGTIGFRGTLVAGKAEGLRSLVVLLGPVGAEGVPPGRIVVTNTVNGEEVSVEIGERGYGTVIEGANLAPRSAFRIPEEELAVLLGALGGADPGTGAAASGQTGDLTEEEAASEPVTDVLSRMSQMEEHAQRAAQGGMLMPPQAVPVSVMPGGRDEGDDR